MPTDNDDARWLEWNLPGGDTNVEPFAPRDTGRDDTPRVAAAVPQPVREEVTRPHDMAAVLEEARAEGRRAGYDAGRADGYFNGFNKGKDARCEDVYRIGQESMVAVFVGLFGKGQRFASIDDLIAEIWRLAPPL